MNEFPRTQYARSGDAYIAYQVVGDGPVDLLFLPHFFQHVELWWENRHRVEFTNELAKFARVILFDKRGTGLSDRTGGVPPFEIQMDDVRAVLDAAGSERAVLWAVGDAAPMILLFTATFPQRTLGLVLSNPFVAFIRKPDLPWLPTLAEFEEQVARVVQNIEDPDGSHLAEVAPSLTAEERREYWRPSRLGTSAGDHLAWTRVLRESDVRHVLSTIRVPTLALTTEGSSDLFQGLTRYAADKIPTARFARLPMGERLFFLGDTRPMIDEVRAFVDEIRHAPPEEPDRVLATVLFTDIVGSTARSAELGDAAWRDLLRDHHSRIRRELSRFRGREIDTAGDGFFATFDGPARAIRCACAARESVRDLGLEIRAGLHAGECELLDDKVTGIAVSLGARVASQAAPGEILVSSTVRDLVAGSGIEFEDRGVAELKGVPGEWRLYAVASSA